MKKYFTVVLLMLMLVVMVSCKCKHEWSDATCEKSQVCSKCGETQGSPRGHKFSEPEIIKEPTCEEPGIEVKKCSICGKEEQEELKIVNQHKFSEPEIIKEPTCEEPGIEVKKCSICGKEEQEELKIVNHTFSDEWTSTEDEHWHAATCMHGNLKEDVGTHIWDEGRIVKKQDCKNDGEIRYTCTSCGFERAEVIPATHNWDEEYICTSCGKKLQVEMIGPGGGYIFYDCDADNSIGNADGLTSNECGWRFLEAAPYDIEIGGETTFSFGEYKEFMNGESLYVNGTTIFDSEDCTSVAIGTGHKNTEKLVETIGDFAYDGLYKKKIENYPAKLCWEFECNGYNDWFLPSRDELKQMELNLNRIGLGNFKEANYWSSSESEDSNDAYYVMFYSYGWYAKGARSGWNSFRVRAIRAF